MNLTQITSELEQQYRIDSYVFLEDLEHSPSSTLYKTLAPYQRPAYENDYRFVFFNFGPLQEATLAHISWVVNYLDISPYFVLLITDQPATAEYFNSTIQVQLVDYHVEHALPKDAVVPVFNNDNRLCAHAWAGLHVWPNGDVSPCCEYVGVITDRRDSPCNIKKHSIKEILNTDYMTLVRQQFKQGKPVAGCINCRVSEQLGGESKHWLTPYKLENIYGNINWEATDPMTNLGFVGGHLGNLCNLKCRICSPVFSSSIATEELESIEDTKNHPTYQLMVNNRWSKQSDAFWTRLKSHADQVCNFELLGGEPLLLKENLEFMQWLVDNGHSQRAIFEFVTNGTQYPAIFEQADQFRRLTLTISIDNIDSRFEYERSGADWNVVAKNVQRFIQNPGLTVGVSITVNIQNVLYLPELIAWLQQQGINHYYFNMLHNPEYLSVDRLTSAAKLLVLDRLTKNNLAEPDREKLQYVIHCVHHAVTSDGREFCQKMQAKDQLRNENFILTHQEIAQAMGYVL